jgi:acetyltransferase-like isoleucine patch superfamily enzyme
MFKKCGENVIIEENVKIGQDVEIGNNVIIKRDVQIGSGSRIEDNVILGYNTISKLRADYQNRDLATIIDESSLIRSGAIIYAGCKIGKNSFVNHNAVLREFTELGDQSSIGNLVMCEGYTKIGDRVVIHSQCHLTAKMIIEDCVFMGPKVTTGNDRKIVYLRCDNPAEVESLEKGPVIRYGARIGGGATILPFVEIGRETLVASGAVVVKDTPPFSIVMGIPARVVGNIPDEEELSGVI